MIFCYYDDDCTEYTLRSDKRAKIKDNYIFCTYENKNELEYRYNIRFYNITPYILNHCLDKYKLKRLLDIDLLIDDELRLCNFIIDLYNKNLDEWLYCLELVFLNNYFWLYINYDSCERSYIQYLL